MGTWTIEAPVNSAPQINSIQVDGNSLSSLVVGANGQIVVSGQNLLNGQPQVSTTCTGVTITITSATPNQIIFGYNVAPSAAAAPCLLTVSAGSNGQAQAGLDVVPSVTIWDGTGGVGTPPSPGVPVGESMTYLVSLSSDASSEPVVLSLPTSGTGSAQFGDGTTSTTITTSTIVTIQGIDASTTSDDLTLLAAPQKSPGRTSATQALSAVSVIITMRNSNTVSGDDAAAATYTLIAGTSNLGPVILTNGYCSNGVELVGKVYPSNYTGTITLRRRMMGGAAYVGSVETAAIPSGDDTSLAVYLDSSPQSGGSAGKVYDVDGPGTTPGLPSGIGRYRNNFQEYAVLGGRAATAQASGYFAWWARSSCTTNSGSPAFSHDVSGDNQSGTGTTKISWNLQ